MKLTSTNRPFGLIIKLSQTVFEEEQNWLGKSQKRNAYSAAVRFGLESNL